MLSCYHDLATENSLYWVYGQWWWSKWPGITAFTHILNESITSKWGPLYQSASCIVLFHTIIPDIIGSFHQSWLQQIHSHRDDHFRIIILCLRVRFRVRLRIRVRVRIRVRSSPHFPLAGLHRRFIIYMWYMYHSMYIDTITGCKHNNTTMSCVHPNPTTSLYNWPCGRCSRFQNTRKQIVNYTLSRKKSI